VDQPQLEKFKKIILMMRAVVLNEVKNDRRKESLRETSGEHSYSFHIADQGSDCNEHEKAYLLASMGGDILEDLDEALDRINDGSYAHCVKCGKEIGLKRLEAIPYARLCIACKSSEEKKAV